MNQNCFDDQAKIGDILSSQKFMTEGYNSGANEASEPTVKNTMLSILDEEHTLQHEVFLEMQKRGWYQTEPAEAQKIQETRTKYNPSTCC